MRKFQVRTYHDKHLAAAIQEKLFELGYKWEGNTNKANLVQLTYAACYDVGYQDKWLIKWAGIDCPSDFDIGITLEEFFQMEPEIRKTIRVGAHTYYEEELKAATKHLTPIK